jgi:TolA-binding protein
MRLRLVFGVFLFAAGCGAPMFTRPAFAQMDSREAIALQNQILDLRRQLQALSDQRGGGGGNSSLGGSYSAPVAPSAGGGGNDMVAQLLDRVSALEDQVRRLQGRIDEADNARQRQIDDLTKQMGDLNFRLQNGGAGAAPGAPPPRAPALSPPPGTLGGGPAPSDGAPPAAPRRTPELILQEGNAALARRDYAAAEAAAKEALAGPRTPRSTDAQFLLAQAMMGRRDYGQAALAYDDAYKRNRTGSHAQDALIGLANAMVGLGDKPASCQALDKLRVEFPAPRPDVREAAAAARGRAGCR